MSDSIVITRPREDAKTLAARLKKKGFHCIIEPILSIKILHRNANALSRAIMHKPQVVLATSKHAISACASMIKHRNIPLICVGRATYEHAITLGFKNVAAASGTAKSLIAYTEKHYSPVKGPVLYIRGKDISTDIAGELGASGFMVESVILYKTVQARKLSETLRKAIVSHKVNSIVFYSENTARTYAALALESKLEKAHRQITAFCMSKPIAETARKLLKWKKAALFPEYLKA